MLTQNLVPYEEDLSHLPKSSLVNFVDESREPIEQKFLYGDRGFLLYKLLSPKECEYYITKCEDIGLEDLTFQKNYRNCHRVIVLSPEISDYLWNRLRPYINPITVTKEDDQQIGKGYRLEGNWEPVGLNPSWRICKYFPGGHFGPHFDGPYIKSENERSLKTLNIYLNENFEGGTTNFIAEVQSAHKDEQGRFAAEPQNILFKLKPAEGMALIFNHHMLHEGGVLDSGVKYIMRSDVMFRRTNPPVQNEKEIEALKLLRIAQDLEGYNKNAEAVQYYRAAFKLWPDIEKEC